jgi:hypothetical protein
MIAYKTQYSMWSLRSEHDLERGEWEAVGLPITWAMEWQNEVIAIVVLCLPVYKKMSHFIILFRGSFINYVMLWGGGGLEFRYEMWQLVVRGMGKSWCYITQMCLYNWLLLAQFLNPKLPHNLLPALPKVKIIHGKHVG